MKKYTLAQSIWPRSGQDQANRSNVEAEGPTEPTVLFQLDLPQHDVLTKSLMACSGLVVVHDGSLRVAKAGFLSAVSQDGKLIWVKELRSQDGLIASSLSMIGPSKLAFIAGNELTVLGSMTS